MSKEQEILHEALHMSLFLAESFEAQIAENTEVRGYSELYVLSKEISGAMYDMYQAIGRKMHDDK